jgi:NAD(P)-dependent dehydrogenase (short-subunit alcohol dehydrogenase family)
MAAVTNRAAVCPTTIPAGWSTSLAAATAARAAPSAARARQERLAGLGQLGAAGVAREQPRPDLVLEPADLAAQRGLGEVERLGDPRPHRGPADTSPWPSTAFRGRASRNTSQMGTDMGRYDGTTVLITGGTSGIGLATARLLRDEGARVVVTGRGPGSIDVARKELGPRVTVLASDAADPTAMDALAANVRETVGAIDLLFVNAGVTAFLGLSEVTEQDYDHLFAVNTRGPYFLVQKLAPLLREGGAVVVTTSIANAKGLPGSSVYAATKAALRSMVRSLARELLPRRVRVNAVSPGPIDTGILERTLPAASAKATRERMQGTNPMQRFGRPEEVATAVAFLGFDATFTTGAELVVDGGASQL